MVWLLGALLLAHPVRAAFGDSYGALVVASGAPRQLAVDDRPAGKPVWSPDGRALAYFRWAKPRGVQLVVNDLRGPRMGADRLWSDGHVDLVTKVLTRPRAVTRRLTDRRAPDVAAEQCGPLWSPDGTKLAFVRRDSDVTVVSVRSRRTWTLRTRRLDDTSRAYAWVNVRVAWSPDGRLLAYSRGDRRGNGQLWVATADGRRARRLTNDVPIDRYAHFSNRSPLWSPDGRRIAFLSTRDGLRDPELFVVDAGRGFRVARRGPSARSFRRSCPSGGSVPHATTRRREPRVSSTCAAARGRAGKPVSVSRDAARLLLLRYGGAGRFVVDVADDEGRVVRTVAGGSLSEDGRSVLVERDGRLVVVDVASGRTALVSRSAGGEAWWLRDGRVAFVGAGRQLRIGRPGGRSARPACGSRSR